MNSPFDSLLKKTNSSKRIHPQSKNLIKYQQVNSFISEKIMMPLIIKNLFIKRQNYAFQKITLKIQLKHISFQLLNLKRKKILKQALYEFLQKAAVIKQNKLYHIHETKRNCKMIHIILLKIKKRINNQSFKTMSLFIVRSKKFQTLVKKLEKNTFRFIQRVFYQPFMVNCLDIKRKHNIKKIFISTLFKIIQKNKKEIKIYIFKTLSNYNFLNTYNYLIKNKKTIIELINKSATQRKLIHLQIKQRFKKLKIQLGDLKLDKNRYRLSQKRTNGLLKTESKEIERQLLKQLDILSIENKEQKQKLLERNKKSNIRENQRQRSQQACQRVPKIYWDIIRHKKEQIRSLTSVFSIPKNQQKKFTNIEEYLLQTNLKLKSTIAFYENHDIQLEELYKIGLKENEALRQTLKCLIKRSYGNYIAEQQKKYSLACHNETMSFTQLSNILTTNPSQKILGLDYQYDPKTDLL